MKRLGSLIEFKESVSRAQAEAALRSLVVAGLIEDASVREYDPDAEGCPVWYIA